MPDQFKALRWGVVWKVGGLCFQLLVILGVLLGPSLWVITPRLNQYSVNGATSEALASNLWLVTICGLGVTLWLQKSLFSELRFEIAEIPLITSQGRGLKGEAAGVIADAVNEYWEHYQTPSFPIER